MGTAAAPVTSADVIFLGSVISRVSGDVAASDTTVVASTSNTNRVRILTSEWNLLQLICRVFGMGDISRLFRRRVFRQCESVEHVLNSGNEVLPSVELISHRRCGHVPPRIQVPQSLPRRGIKSQQIPRSIGAEKNMAGGGKDSRATFPFAGFVVPDHLACAILGRAWSARIVECSPRLRARRPHPSAFPVTVR